MRLTDFIDEKTAAYIEEKGLSGKAGHQAGQAQDRSERDHQERGHLHRNLQAGL